MKGKKLTVLAILLAASAYPLVSCDDPVGPSVDDSSSVDNGGFRDEKVYTYKDYTAVSPSNWNELTYQDNNDTQIMSYLGSSFFSYDFKFDDNGEIIDGEFTINYDAATKLEDVTAEYAEDDNYSVPNSATDGYAYKITLREGLKWDDGTPIDANDFVYSMQEQLNPLFENYRMDSFYVGATVIHKAKDYVYQNKTKWHGADEPYSVYDASLDDKLIFSLAGKGEDYGAANAISYVRSWLEGSVFGTDAFGANVAAANLPAIFGLTNVTGDQILALEGKTFAQIKADASLKATWDALIGAWQTEPNEELHFFITEYSWPSVSNDELGIFVGDNDLELVVVLDSYLSLLDAEGNLTFKAAYNFASLPLVHRQKYEANKHAPSGTNSNWTSTYNSSVETSASWGPYKLTEFQAGKHYTLTRNDNWHGYSLPLYDGQYQTDIIDVETIAEYNTAFMKFEAGELNGIGIDVSVAADYKNSERAIYTGDDYVGSLQIQSNKEALATREEDGENKTILANKDFRNAISLAIDRADYANKVTTAQKAGFGIFNSYHYYDVANGGVYRNTDEARKALCDAYGVDVSKFATLEEAADSITGYSPAQAKILVDKAYDTLFEAGEISATDKVVITFGSSVDNESTRRQYNYLSEALIEMVKGTKLEGRLETEFNASFGNKWADDFRDGKYDICTGGWSGAAWDPGYFLLAYLSPDYMYSKSWNTSTHMLSYLPVDAKDLEGNDITEALEMSLLDWYAALNGSHPAYNWADGSSYCTTQTRLGIIAALETEILCEYYTVPITYYYSASLLSYQCEYITTEYNTFMGYGGIRYMTYNYDDAGWADFIKNNTLNYKG